MSDILVIKCDLFLNNKTYKELYEGFVNQKATGVVLLPPGYEAIVVPEDVEIKMAPYEESELYERYKTCGRCIHYGESSDIVGSTCYKCKRNPDYHRIDWFEERKDNDND